MTKQQPRNKIRALSCSIAGDEAVLLAPSRHEFPQSQGNAPAGHVLGPDAVRPVVPGLAGEAVNVARPELQDHRLLFAASRRRLILRRRRRPADSPEDHRAFAHEADPHHAVREPRQVDVVADALPGPVEVRDGVVEKRRREPPPPEAGQVRRQGTLEPTVQPLQLRGGRPEAHALVRQRTRPREVACVPQAAGAGAAEAGAPGTGGGPGSAARAARKEVEEKNEKGEEEGEAARGGAGFPRAPRTAAHRPSPPGEGGPRRRPARRRLPAER
ncbi:MAG: LOW QUALITY PROTEIN: hypothetical protein BJ554DRAFT_3060 [Olpidium bornovanus]|uniref:Uncharacterized protein n=1 Tax=Olpidium bornovanus TaxID=278681 RepID=A0A8H7ZQ25_9FUNG|nr:MAG: LOW QUALITY PROTEIN: hypothetical protein BJ554DRAFT_3060 [Olpidium bornovanus]